MNSIVSFYVAISFCGRGDGHAGRGGVPQEINLRRGQGVGTLHSALRARSRARVSTARARAGSKVRVRSSHKAWRPAAD
jgi:hypothetical protein